MSRSQRSRRRRRGRGRPRSKALLAGLVAAIVAALAGLGVVGYVVSVAASAPPLSSLKPKDPGENSVVYAADGTTRLGFIQANELRQPIAGKDIPKSLKNATVAIEDERFYRHRGVDYEGVVRAAVKNVANRKTVEGGSTITMQLVRNLFITRERTYERKIREAKLAEELENGRSKAWILDQYLNSVPFGTVGGQSAIGAEAAARIYFDKRAEKLELHESALLAGLPQAPSLYSPFRSPEAALARRNQVLRKMAELKMIAPATARRAMRRDLGLHDSTYFTNRREKYFFDYVKDELIKEYGPRLVRQGGLRVDTTIDLTKQSAAREAITGRLGEIGPSGAIVTLDARTGEILAMASSATYAKSKFNLAAQGHRQPGSTFKIMALMAALSKGVDPSSTRYVSRSPIKFNEPKYGPPFEVKTYDGSSRGSIDLVRATLASDNSVYMQLALDLGPEEVKRTARDMGIRSVLKAYPAETLGGLEQGVSPLEMATAYATIASGGYRFRPTAIKKVTFPDGKAERRPRFKVKKARVFDPAVAAKGQDILIKNIESGTGKAADIGCAAGGKTGTTDKHTDAWFVGFTPRLSTAVWVGYPRRNQQMLYEYHGASVAGGTYPAEIWGDYMKRAKGRFCGKFRDPGTPFQTAPFFGKYARSGGKLLQGTPGTEEDDGFGPGFAPGPAPAPTTRGGGDDETIGTTESADGEGGGERSERRGGAGAENTAEAAPAESGEGGGAEFDPRFYESPGGGEDAAGAPDGA